MENTMKTTSKYLRFPLTKGLKPFDYSGSIFYNVEISTVYSFPKYSHTTEIHKNLMTLTPDYLLVKQQQFQDPQQTLNTSFHTFC